MATVEIVIQGKDETSGMFGNIGGALSNLGNIVTGIKAGFDLLAGAFNNIVEFGNQFVVSASESEQAVARLEGILRATGGAAGVSSQELQDLAGSLQGVTRFSDETILTGAAVLLTFRNIGEETLMRTIPAMLDMAEIFGSVDSAAMQLGKALNDPVSMMGALSRAGVTFSEVQKDMIKNFVETGNIAGAQNIILSEVEAQVGSLAEAMGKTFAGQVEIAKNKLDEMKEIIGGPVLSVLGDLLTKLMEFADTNPVIQGVIGFFERFNDLLRSEGDIPFLSALGAAMLGLENLSPILHDIGYALIVMQGGLNLGLEPLEAFKKGLADLAIVWKDTPLESVITAIQNFIETGETEGWGTAISDLFSVIWTNLDIPTKIQNLVDTMTVAVANADWSGVVDTLADVVAEVIRLSFRGLDVIVNEIDWGPMGIALRGAFSEAWQGAMSGIDVGYILQTYVVDPIVAWIRENFTDRIVADFMVAWDSWAEVGQAMKDGFTSAMNWSWDADKWVHEKIIDPIKKWLGISSPSSVFMEIGKNIIQGLWDGMASMWNNFVDWIGEKIGAILAVLTPAKLLEIALTDLTLAEALQSAYTGTTIPGGGTGSGTGTGGGTGSGSGTVVNQYFAGATINVGSWSEIAYDCIYPNPFVAATSGQLGTGGGGSVGGR